jgi:hypothetical protein
VGGGAAVLMVAVDLYSGHLAERGEKDANEAARWVTVPLYSLLRGTAERKDNPEWSTVNAYLYAIMRKPVLRGHLRWARRREPVLAVHANIALGHPQLESGADVLTRCLSGGSAPRDSPDESGRAVIAQPLLRNGKPAAILALDAPSSHHAWLKATTPLAIVPSALSLTQILAKGGVRITSERGKMWL